MILQSSFAALTGSVLACTVAFAQENLPPPDTQDLVEIVELMLGRAPSRHATPLAAMHGRAELYVSYKDRAWNNDAGAISVWLLLADIAVRSNDASLTQSYTADIVPVYLRHTETFLEALNGAPWLAPSTCELIAGHFGSEDRTKDNLATFLEAEAQRFQDVLPKPVAADCIAELTQVE